MLVDVVDLVSGGEDLTLVDVIRSDGLEDLGLHEVSDSGLGHHRDGHCLHDLLDHLWIAHAGDTPVLSDVGRDALEGHDGHGARLLRDAGLLGVDDIHDNATLEHLSETDLREGSFGAGVGVGVGVGTRGLSRVSVRSKRKKEKRDGDPRRRRRPESTVDVDHRALRRGSATGSSTALTSGALAFQFDSARRLASSQVDDFRRRRSREALFGVGEKGSAGVPLSRSYLDGHGTLLHRSVPVLVCVPVAVHLSYLFFVFVRASAVAALFCLLLPPSSVQFSGLPLSQQPGLR
mmetsp:Transcript_4308/g.15454  ORF Transcript_4308/g.15454 Transcript_4308/m.15454 type:complete len:291 (-) Transcript_4308:17-889(-)